MKSKNNLKPLWNKTCVGGVALKYNLSLSKTVVISTELLPEVLLVERVRKISPISSISKRLEKLLTKKAAFTLAEVLITLSILGVIAALTVPSIIQKQREAANRTKIKKAMTVYDLAVNKMVVENNLKSDDALTEWAGENCSNSAAYFKITEKLSEDTSCVFRVSDGLYWDITDIENPIVAQTEDDLTKMQNGEDAGTNAFRLSAWFDEKGSLRVNDLARATDTKDELTRLYNYVYNKKVEQEYSFDDEIDKIAKGEYNKLCNEPVYKNSDFEKCTNCKKCYVYDTKWREYRFYDSRGQEILSRRNCTGGVFNCNSTNSIKYYRDENGNSIVHFINCDDNGNCKTCENFYNHNCEDYGYSCKNQETDSYCYK